MFTEKKLFQKISIRIHDLFIFMISNHVFFIIIHYTASGNYSDITFVSYSFFFFFRRTITKFIYSIECFHFTADIWCRTISNQSILVTDWCIEQLLSAATLIYNIYFRPIARICVWGVLLYARVSAREIFRDHTHFSWPRPPN